MQFVYSVFGLYLHSNQPIPGLANLPDRPSVDVQVWLDLQPLWLSQQLELLSSIGYVSDDRDEKGDPIWMLQQLGNGDYLQLSYCDRTQFIIDRAGTEIWATWPEELTLEDTATYLLGPVLGLVLRLRGITCLHASAVAVGKKAIVLVGASGAGKSTTAAAFAKLGYPVLSDDIVALTVRENTFSVQPAYPRLRLWSESVNILYGKSDALPRIVPTHPHWDKRYLDPTFGLVFQDSPLPLGAIYLLGKRTLDPSAPYLETLPSQNALIQLIVNTYANVLLDKKMRAEEFNCLSQVVTSIPVMWVTANADPACLSKLCQVIIADFYS